MYSAQPTSLSSNPLFVAKQKELNSQSVSSSKPPALPPRPPMIPPRPATTQNDSMSQSAPMDNSLPLLSPHFSPTQSTPMEARVELADLLESPDRSKDSDSSRSGNAQKYSYSALPQEEVDSREAVTESKESFEDCWPRFKNAMRSIFCCFCCFREDRESDDIAMNRRDVQVLPSSSKGEQSAEEVDPAVGRDEVDAQIPLDHPPKGCLRRLIDRIYGCFCCCFARSEETDNDSDHHNPTPPSS